MSVPSSRLAPEPNAAAPDDVEPSVWPDESAESAFLAEAREQGEPALPPKPQEASGDDVEAKALPSLEELVQRIPPEVRDVLEDLFRVKFTTVRRIPRKALKG